MVKPLSDRELVIAQDQENSARAALSFIERARFVQALELLRYKRDVIEAVALAPAAGRERWTKLASAFARRAAERPIDPLLDAASFAEAPSDQRFTMLYKHLTGKAPLPYAADERRRHEVRFGLSVATATITDRAFIRRLDRALGRGLGDFLVRRLEGLFEDYTLATRWSNGKAVNIRHSLGR
jgi:ParB family chromosome partitioning protein